MVGRAFFKAVIKVDDIEVPIKFHSAVRDERVRFRLLHKSDEQPLQQKLYCSQEDQPVDPDEQVRGYEVARRQYIVLEPEQIRDARPPGDQRSIEVLHFVNPADIDPRLLERPYYLGQDGQPQDYAILARALDQSGRAGICSWIMRRRHYIGVLQSLDGLLLMITLRFAHQLNAPERLRTKQPQLSDKELRTAKALIDELHESFDISDYQDDHQQRLMHFIEQKAHGEEPDMKRPRRRRATTPARLQSALEESLEQLGKR